MKSAINSNGIESLPLLKLESTLESSKYCFFSCVLSFTHPCTFNFYFLSAIIYQELLMQIKGY